MCNSNSNLLKFSLTDETMESFSSDTTVLLDETSSLLEEEHLESRNVNNHSNSSSISSHEIPHPLLLEKESPDTHHLTSHLNPGPSSSRENSISNSSSNRNIAQISTTIPASSVSIDFVSRDEDQVCIINYQSFIFKFFTFLLISFTSAKK